MTNDNPADQSESSLASDLHSAKPPAEKMPAPVAADQAPDFAPDVHEADEPDEAGPSEETDLDDAADGVPLQKVYRDKNFTPHSKGTSRISILEFDNRKEVIILPSTTQAGSDEILSHLENALKIEDDRAGSLEYVRNLVIGSQSQPQEGFNDRAAQRADAQWTQELKHNGKNLMPGAPPVASDTTNLTPEASRRLFRSNFKLGTLFQVPLYHSGFWITLRAPGESELIELTRQVTQEKAIVGRQTYGRLYSNTTVFTAKHLMRFIVDKLLYQTTLALPEGDDILKYIALPDLQILIWGMACAHYATGFQFSRVCTTDALKCRFEVKEKINPTRMFWFDQTRLSEVQLTHMSEKKPKVHTLDSVTKYRNEFMIGRNKVVKIGSSEIELTLPSMASYADAGEKWISSVEATYGSAMTVDESERQAYLMNQIKATAMREYAHCVAKMTTNLDAEVPFEETRSEAINKILEDLSTNDEVREKFIEETRLFLEDASMAFVAVESYTCPACNGKQRPSEPGFPHDELLPIDAMNTFFQLAYQRVNLIQQRDLKVENQ
jgi:hypothetical protein